MKKIIAFLSACCIFMTGFGNFGMLVQAADDLRVYDTQTEYMDDPIGIDRQDLSFSWKISKGTTRGVTQTSYTIRVAENKAELESGIPLWSCTQNSDTCNGIYYDGPTLKGGTQYFWNVTVTDSAGASATSETATFGMGLLEETDWNDAKWIAIDPDPGEVETIASAYTIEVDFNMEYGSLGLIFGDPDTNTFYMWQLNSDEGENGHLLFRPHKFIGNTPTLIGEYDIEHIMTRDEFLTGDHTFRVEADNGRFTAWIDGEIITYEVPHGTTKVSDKTYLADDSIESIKEVGIRAFYGDVDKDKLSLSRLVLANDETGKLLYWDDFTGNNSLSGGTIEEGRLILAPTAEERYWPRSSSDSVYSVQMDVQVESVAAGIIFGAQNESNFYMWQLNTLKEDLYLRPHYWSGYGNLIAEKNIENILSKNDAENQMNQMRIDVEDGKITTILNGQVADVCEDSRYESFGLIGFRQDWDEATTAYETAAYDNIMVRDAGGHVIYFEGFEDGSNPYGFGDVYNGALTVTKDGNNSIFLIEEATMTNNSAVPLYRKDFDTPNKEITRATVYASSLGHYELQLNGEKVGEDYMAPGWTEYATRVQYQSYDITDQLKKGQTNTLGAMIGPGWYSGNISILGNNRYGVEQSFIANLVIEYADGSTQAIVTDDTWAFSLDGPILVTDMFNGETYDANRELGGSKYGWAVSDYDNSGWRNARVKYDSAYSAMTDYGAGPIQLTAQIGPTVSKIADVMPVSITTDVNGNYIVDMGQNFAGIINIDLTGEQGQTAVLRFGEMLNDDSGTGDGPEGTLYMANLRTADATDYYVFASNKKETFEQTFTFHGFQYIEISGVSKIPAIEDIRGIALASSMEETGSFDSSSDLLNQIYENTLWGQRSNFLSIPTDCPQRDERMGWGADTHVFVETGMYNMNAMMFYQKWLQDVRDGQYSDGAYGDTAPNPHGMKGDVVWNAGGIVVPYTLWQMTGDTRVLTDSYDSMVHYMQYRASQGLIQNCGYGDWLEPNEGASDGQVVGTTYYAYQLSLMADMADALGKSEEAQVYRDQFERVRTAFTDAYINEDGTFDNDIQSAYLLTLGAGLATEENEQVLVENLVARIQADSYLMSVGFVSVNMLMPVLTKCGYTEIAYLLASNTDYPSWGYSVEQGATTIWERWNSYTRESGFGDISMNSFNHYSFGSVVEWYYSGIGGIGYDPADPGFRNIKVEPVLDRTLTYADVSYESVRGKIESRWKILDDGKVQIIVTVPANTTADVTIPDVVPGITESGAALSAGINGITAISEDTEAGTTVVSVGSGTYNFNFNWESEFSTIKLEQALDAGGEKLLQLEDYTPDSLRTLRKAVETAEAVLAESRSTQDQAAVDNATTAIREAIDNLEASGYVNLALGKSATASSSVAATGNFSPEKLVDGTRSGGGSTTWSSNNSLGADHTEWVIIDLHEVAAFNRIVIYPRNDGAPSGYGFPKDFDIKISNDGENWETVFSETDYPYVGTNVQRFELEEPVTAQYVKIDMYSLNMNPADGNSFRAQLAEIEIYNILFDPDDVDRTELQDYVEALKTLDENDYTYDSWTVLRDALADAQVVLDNDASRQTAVDDALAELKQAVSGLKQAAHDTWYLEYVIELAEQYADEAETAIPYVKAMYADALAAAQELFEKAAADPRDVSLEETDETAYALLRTLRWLSYQSGDKGSLYDAIQKAEDILANRSDYKEDTLEGMETLLASAKSVYYDENALDADIIAATEQLEEAVGKARKKDASEADRTRLAALIREAEEILENSDAYIAGSIEGLDIILAQAIRIYNDAEASQEQIDKAVKNLTDAIGQARLLPDRSKLEALIYKAETFNREAYTEESWQAFAAALETALIIYKDENADQAEINDAYGILKTAMDGLVKLSADSDPDPSGTESGGGSSASEDMSGTDGGTPGSTTPSTGDRSSSLGFAATGLTALFAALILIRKSAAKGK